jgi:hypothetical protein
MTKSKGCLRFLQNNLQYSCIQPNSLHISHQIQVFVEYVAVVNEAFSESPHDCVGIFCNKLSLGQLDLKLLKERGRFLENRQDDG